jgi:hypothetical protein
MIESRTATPRIKLLALCPPRRVSLSDKEVERIVVGLLGFVTAVQRGTDGVAVGGGQPLHCRLLAHGGEVASWRQ